MPLEAPPSCFAQRTLRSGPHVKGLEPEMVRRERRRNLHSTRNSPTVSAEVTGRGDSPKAKWRSRFESYCEPPPTPPSATMHERHAKGVGRTSFTSDVRSSLRSLARPVDVARPPSPRLFDR